MVLKSEIEKAVEEQGSILSEKEVGIPRDALEQAGLSKELILVITGIRRAGKSTLMKQMIERSEEELAFFNFEDPRVLGFARHDYEKLEAVLGAETKDFYFDEIQNGEAWELFIRKLHEKGKRIVLTGSNASLLSHELGSRLTGRYKQIELFPFSYREYLRFREDEAGNGSLRNYLEEGGFPGYLKTGDPEVLQQLFRDIVNRDIIVRHGIRNSRTLTDIALHLLSNAGKEFSLNRIRKNFRLGSANSVADYVRWLEDSYLLFTLPRFSWSPKSVAVNPRKVYAIDPGFARANSLSFSEDSGRLLENLVFLELRRQREELFYFREEGECDFVVREGKKVTRAIQVCWELTPDNSERELGGLGEALRTFDLEEGTILTLDQEDELEQNGKRVCVIPAWKFLLAIGDEGS